MEFKTEKNFVPYGECVTICKICQVILGGDSGIDSKQYVVCDKCKNKSMKINQLKVGDKIKFTLGQNTRVGNILEMTECKISVDAIEQWYSCGGLWIRKDQVIAKLEPAPDKETPIEFPAPPFEFVFQPQEANVHNNIDEYGNYRYTFSHRIVSTFTEVRGINCKSEPVTFSIPYSLQFKSNTNYKVTIEEIP